MQAHRLLSGVIALSALTAPMMASANPAAAIAHTRPVSNDAVQPTPAPAAETENYAEREQQTPAAAEYVGGRSGVYIGGGALVVVLIILVVILLI